MPLRKLGEVSKKKKKKSKKAKKSYVLPVKRVEVLDPAVDWIVEQSPLSERDRSDLDQVASTNTAKLKLFLHIVAAQKVNDLRNLFTLIDEVKSKLYNKEKLDFADTKTLVSMLRTLNEEKTESLGFIQSIVSDGAPGISVHSILAAVGRDESSLATAGQIKKMHPEKRESIRMVFAQLEKIVKGEGNKSDSGSDSST